MDTSQSGGDHGYAYRDINIMSGAATSSGTPSAIPVEPSSLVGMEASAGPPADDGSDVSSLVPAPAPDTPSKREASQLVAEGESASYSFDMTLPIQDRHKKTRRAATDG